MDNSPYGAVLESVVSRAREAGVLRPDFGANDLATMIGAVSKVNAISDGDDAVWRRQLGFVLDGGGRLLEDGAHGLFEPDDVFGGQLGRQVAVAVDDRSQQPDVFGDVFGDVRQSVKEQAPDAGRVGVLADQHVLQIRVAGGLVDRGMDPYVEP